jgi:hypothetical protein
MTIDTKREENENKRAIQIKGLQDYPQSKVYEEGVVIAVQDGHNLP